MQLSIVGSCNSFVQNTCDLIELLYISVWNLVLPSDQFKNEWWASLSPLEAVRPLREGRTSGALNT